MLRRFRSNGVRAIAALVWCGIVAARPLAVPCPVGGHGEHAVAHGQTHSVHAHHAGMSMPAAPEQSPAPESAPHQCDCLGNCCASVADAPRAFATTFEFSESQQRPAAVHPRAQHIAEWSDFVLPFANAPPVSDHT